MNPLIRPNFDDEVHLDFSNEDCIGDDPINLAEFRYVQGTLDGAAGFSGGVDEPGFEEAMLALCATHGWVEASYNEWLLRLEALAASDERFDIA